MAQVKTAKPDPEHPYLSPKWTSKVRNREPYDHNRTRIVDGNGGEGMGVDVVCQRIPAVGGIFRSAIEDAKKGDVNKSGDSRSGHTPFSRSPFPQATHRLD